MPRTDNQAGSGYGGYAQGAWTSYSNGSSNYFGAGGGGVRAVLAATTAKVSIQVRKSAVTELETVAVCTAAVEGGVVPWAVDTAHLGEYALSGVWRRRFAKSISRTNTVPRNRR